MSMENNRATDLTKIWGECLSRISSSVTKQSFKTWFEPIVPVEFTDGELKIRVPSQFFYEWLEDRYYPLITKTLADVTGRETKVSHCILSPDDEIPTVSSTEPQAPVAPPNPVLLPNHIFQARPADRLSANYSSASSPRESFISHPQAYAVTGSTLSSLNRFLHPRYTFENFIKGDSNQLARAAALAVANNPGGTSFNPLVIYGGVGLGKTHLVHAIGNQLLKADPSKRVLYTSSEKFTVDFVESIQRDNVSEFSNYYRSVDLLMVDDIQFFTGKEKTQDIFFHTFNTLHQMGKQIVLSSDKPPKELKGLNERLVSRFQWGLTADIQPPDLETRIAILLKKSSDDGVELSHEVVEFIAANITSNIRELEGCLISLLARASLENKKIDLDLARSVVRSIVGEVKTHITIDEIQRTVCEHLSIPQDLIRAKTRKQEIDFFVFE